MSRARALFGVAALGALGVALLVAPRVDAQSYRMPSTCTSTKSCMFVSAYFDNGGVKDWDCGANTYAAHKGTDFAIVGGFTAMDAGRDVLAAAAGKVTDAHDGEYDRSTSTNRGVGYGNYVVVKHADGKSTMYGHFRTGTVAVAVGDSVACGQKLGQVGSSGNSTGPHLHFEVRLTSGTVDDPFAGPCSGPLSYWVAQGVYEGLPKTTCDALDGGLDGAPDAAQDAARDTGADARADASRGDAATSDGATHDDASAGSSPPSDAADPRTEGTAAESGSADGGGCRLAKAARPSLVATMTPMIVAALALARRWRRRRRATGAARCAR